MSGPADAGTTRFSVWRQDDHGNRFEVARGLSLADAARELERLESSGHKQTYWIAPTGPSAERL